jgi:hypothetical protein
MDIQRESSTERKKELLHQIFRHCTHPWLMRLYEVSTSDSVMLENFKNDIQRDCCFPTVARLKVMLDEKQESKKCRQKVGYSVGNLADPVTFVEETSLAFTLCTDEYHEVARQLLDIPKRMNVKWLPIHHLQETLKDHIDEIFNTVTKRWYSEGKLDRLQWVNNIGFHSEKKQLESTK